MSTPEKLPLLGEQIKKKQNNRCASIQFTQPQKKLAEKICTFVQFDLIRGFETHWPRIKPRVALGKRTPVVKLQTGEVCGRVSGMICFKLPLPAHRLALILSFTMVVVFSLSMTAMVRAADAPFIVSRFAEAPVTYDGAHTVEGTATAPTFAWHARQQVRYQFDFGLANRAGQFVLDQIFGLGLPLRLEAALSFPVGWTIGSKAPADGKPGPRHLDGMAEDGPGIGDLKPVLLFSAYESQESGLGLLLGVELGIPTGDHDRLLGEGGFSMDGLVALAFEVFGSRLAFNLLYRLRPEHRYTDDANKPFEQDDDIVWRVGLRIPRKNDVAWAVEAEGAVGILTDDGIWPKSPSRGVWLGAGVDYPLGRLHRMGMNIGLGLTGQATPSFTFGMTLMWQPVLPDEDKDGVPGVSDECALLNEDWDGFQDDDGCPDLDNDKDGWPDDEDKCPLAPGDDFSEDGCPSP
jgi:OmpA-OmpF porin, OOP family